MTGPVRAARAGKGEKGRLSSMESMGMTDVSRLLYARGFLLTRSEASVPEHWSAVSLGAWTFYHDPVAAVAVRGGTLLFGHAIDLRSGEGRIGSIAERIDESDGSARQDLIDHLAGRFLVVQATGDDLRLQQDAAGLRAVYWTDRSERFFAGSHQKLVAEQISAGRSDFAGGYLSRNGFQVTPGRATSHLGVVRLLPNTELGTGTRDLERVYPRDARSEASVGEVAGLVIDSVDAQLPALRSTPDVVVSLSAGLDSRTTLALLRPIIDHLTFFTYDLNYREKNDGNRHDRATALALVESFGLRHRMLDISEAVTSGPLASVLARNTEFSHSRAVTAAYLALQGSW